MDVRKFEVKHLHFQLLRNNLVGFPKGRNVSEEEYISET